jgi:EAL domain-containing protein (putative c-di-GMP-specific phosphodiesterase class I)
MQTLAQSSTTATEVAAENPACGATTAWGSASPVTYLQRFPVTTVKIDRSFVAGLGTKPRDQARVSAVTALGSALDVQVIAEGVETPLQLEVLKRIGCPFGQGWHFGEPQPASQFLKASTS